MWTLQRLRESQRQWAGSLTVKMFRSVGARLSALWQNGFFRSAGMLVGGTATAQALTILALPILTRIYSPEDFSVLAVYTALLTMVAVISCLRLEIAIPLPEDDGEAVNLFALAFVFATIAAVLTCVGVVLFGPVFFQAIRQPQMQPYGWLLPLGVWMSGSYAALQYWATRKKRFSVIARTRMTQVGSGLVAQLGLGWAGAGTVGLLLGHVLMAGSGVISLIRQALNRDLPVLRMISTQGMVKAFSHYKRFPQYSTVEALANNAAIQVPVLLIGALAIGPEAGFVMLATRALGTPVTLVGNAVAQVYLSRAPEAMRKGNLGEFSYDILQGLARVGVGPLVFIAVIAPSAFALMFGEEWRRSGELVAWMTPWFIFKLLSSPISMVMHVKMMQRAMMGLMVVGLLLRIAVTMGAYAFDPAYIAEGYALSGMGFYLITFIVYLAATGSGWRSVNGLIVSALLPALLATGAGFLCLQLISII